MTCRLTIAVCTRNRPKYLSQCIHSIFRNDLSGCEVVVVDQSDGEETEEQCKGHDQIRYFRSLDRGHSKARNLAISKAKGIYIAFTDDDCIVSDDWVMTIISNLTCYDVILGSVLPSKTHKGRGGQCTALLYNKSKTVFTKVDNDVFNFVKGNNMVIKRSVLKDTGGFREWLGVGSIGYCADEGEMICRIIDKGYRIVYLPEAKIYHNHWLTRAQYNRHYFKYQWGAILACFYYINRKEYRELLIGRLCWPFVRYGKNLQKEVIKKDIGAASVWLKLIIYQVMYSVMFLAKAIYVRTRY